MKTYGGFLMSRIRNLSGRVWERMLKEYGVDAFNGAQGRILYVLWEKGTLSISEIGKLTSLASTTLTSMLDRMEEAGLIERSQDINNRRRTLVRASETALGFKEKYEQISQRMNEVFYAGFTECEIDEFEEKLRRIIKNFAT